MQPALRTGARLLPALLLSLAVGACGPRREQPAPIEREPAVGIPAPAGAAYAIQTDDSVIQLLVYRGGPMARLGHNHVILARNLQGTVWAGEDPRGAAFDIRFAVTDLQIDPPAARRDAGADFPSEIPQADIDGTRRNMLGEELLDGLEYPEIRLRSMTIAANDAAYRVRTRVTLKGIDSEVEFAARVTRTADRLLAEGELPLLQSQLGLKPFSVMLGALQVQDEMRVRFRIAAARRHAQ